MSLEWPCVCASQPTRAPSPASPPSPPSPPPPCARLLFVTAAAALKHTLQPPPKPSSHPLILLCLTPFPWATPPYPPAAASFVHIAYFPCSRRARRMFTRSPPPPSPSPPSPFANPQHSDINKRRRRAHQARACTRGPLCICLPWQHCTFRHLHPPLPPPSSHPCPSPTATPY